MAYSPKTDTDIRNAILEKKFREQAIKDEEEKNGCSKNGDNRKQLPARPRFFLFNRNGLKTLI